MCTPCIDNTTLDVWPLGVIARRGRLVRRVPSPLVRVRHYIFICSIDVSVYLEIKPNSKITLGPHYPSLQSGSARYDRP